MEREERGGGCGKRGGRESRDKTERQRDRVVRQEGGGEIRQRGRGAEGSDKGGGVGWSRLRHCASSCASGLLSEFSKRSCVYNRISEKVATSLL
jgi:hypothetical protein